MKFFFYFVAFLFLGCHSYNEFDASIVAKDYCDCMRAKNPTNSVANYWYAKKVCDGVLTEKYYFFRFMEVESNVQSGKSKDFLDSLRYFVGSYDDQVRAKCCEIGGNCREVEGSPILNYK